MSAVDERVVRMEFDNKQFEKNIKESIKSLDDLDKQLGLVDDEDAFDNIDRNSKKIDFKNMLTGLDNLSSGFSVLEKIATGALLRIGSKLADTVTKYSGFLTFQQIGAGWQKFAEYANATQSTISAISDTWIQQATDTTRKEYLRQLTGDAEDAEKLWEAINDPSVDGQHSAKQWKKNAEKIADSLNIEAEAFEQIYDNVYKLENRFTTAEEYVEGYVDKLNWYSDETSYNFTDMISTLGKFTAAGQKLEDSSIAIQGMMNMVATAGGNAEVGQRVAYNLSQAMSAGSLKMIDWKSLQNANVATVEFKQRLIDTAVALGTVQEVTDKAGNTVYKYGKETFSATENFESSLSKGWATSKVLQKTLEAYGKFSDGMYQITQDFQDYDLTATGIFEDLDAYEEKLKGGDTSQAAADWDARMKETFGDNKEAIDKYTKALDKMINDPDYDFGKKVFGDAQKAKTFKDAIDATADAASTKWATVFKYLFGSSERAKEFWSGFTDTLYDLFVAPLDDILNLFKKVQREQQFLIKNDSGEFEKVDAFEAFRRSLENLQEVLLAIVTPIREAFNAVFGEGAPEKIANMSKRFYEFTQGLKLSDEQIEKIQESFTGVFSVIKGVGKIIGGAIKGVFNFVKPIFGLIKPIFGVILSITGAIGRLISAFKLFKTIKDLKGTSKAVESEGNIIARVVGWITEKLEAFSKWIDETFTTGAFYNVIKSVGEFFGKAWNTIKTAAEGAWNAIKPFLPTFEEIKGVLSSIWSTVKEFLPSWEEVVAALAAGWEMFKQIAGTIWNFLQPYIQKLADSFSKFAKSLGNFVKGFAESDDKLGYIKDHIRGLVDSFLEWKRNSKFIKWVIDRFEDLKGVIEKIKEALKPKGEGEGLSGGQMFGILYIVAGFVALFAIIRKFGGLARALKNISETIRRFGKTLNKAVIFVGIYLVAKAIAELIEALTAFAQLKFGQIVAGVASIIIIAATLLAFAFIMKTITDTMKPEQVKNFGRITVMLAVILLAIALSLKMVSKANGEDLVGKALIMVALLAALVIAAWALDNYIGEIKFNKLLAMIILAAVLVAVALAVKTIGQLSPDQFEQAKNIVMIIGAFAIAAMIVSSILKNGSDAIKNIGIAVAAMAAALLMVVISLKILQGITLDWGMVGTIFAVLAIIGVLAAIPFYLSNLAKSNSISSKDMLKMAATVTIMTGSLLLIAIALGIMAKAMSKAGISSGEMFGLAMSLAVIAVALGAMSWMMGKAVSAMGESKDKINKIKQVAKAMRKMVVSIVLIAATIAILSKLGITVDNSMDAIFIVGAIMVALTMMTYAMADASSRAGEKGIKSGPIIAMVLGIIALVFTLMLLTKFMQSNGDGIGNALVIMIAIALTLAAALYAIGIATDRAGSKGLQWAPIAVLVAGMIGIMQSLIALSVMDQGALRKSAWSVAIVGGVLAALIAASAYLSSNMDSTGNMIRSVIMIAAVVAALFFVADILKSLSGVEGVADNALILGLLIGGLMFVMTYLSNSMDSSAKGWSQTAQSIVMMGAIILAVIGMAYALKQLEDINVSWDTILQIVVVLAALGIVFGLIGGIAGASGAGAVGLLAVSVMIIAIAAALLILSVAAVIAGQALPSLADGIVKLGDAISTISFSWDQLGKLAGALVALGLTVIPIAIAFSIAALALGVAFILAGVGATMLSSCLPQLSEGIKMLGDAIASIEFSWDQLGKLAVALLILAVLGVPSAIAVSVAVLVLSMAMLLAGAAFSVVADVIPLLCTGITLLVTTLVGVSGVALQAAGSAFLLMFAFIFLGVGAIALSIGVGAAAVALIIASVAIFLFSGALIAASLAITALSLSISLFAKGIALVSDVFTGGDMASKVDGFSSELQEGGAKITETLKEVKDNMSEAAGGEGFNIMDLFGGGEGGFDISSLKDSLLGGLTGEGGLFGGDFGSMLGGDFMNSLGEGMDPSMLTSMMGDKFGNMDWSSVTSGAGTGLMSSFQTSVEETDMTEAGNTVATSFTDTVESPANLDKSRSSGQQLGLRGNVGARGTHDSWLRSGNYLGDGLVSGIREKLQAAYNAGWDIADNAVKGANDRGVVSSPSRAFMEIGKYMVEGFAIGIDDNVDLAYDSASDMVYQSLGAASELIADTIENNYTNPVIRPTLDLSSVAEGASTISSLFGRQSVGVDGDVDGTGSRSGSGNTINYVQNNYSPKALNRMEIYRQTRNQISLSQQNVLAKV